MTLCCSSLVSATPLQIELTKETWDSTERPFMMSGQVEGTLLRLLIQLAGARRVLEIGTFTGYSALTMAAGLPDDGRLITCDVNEETSSIARRYWANSPHGHKIELRVGPALDTIAAIEGDFDFVFIDGHKPDYLLYFDRLMPLVKVGGLIAAHDIAGMPDHMRDYFDMLKVHPGLETVITADNTGEGGAVVAGPGIALSRKTGASMDGVADWGRGLARRVIAGVRDDAVPDAAMPYTVLKEYKEAHFSGAALLVDGSAGEEEVVALCRCLRGRYERTAPGDDLSIHIYKDREAFDGRNDLNLPAERYFAGYAAEIRVIRRTGCDEIRCFSGFQMPAPL